MRREGLEMVLFQLLEDYKLHPVAYKKCSLTAAKRNDGVTELKTLAIILEITHFHLLSLWKFSCVVHRLRH